MKKFLHITLLSLALIVTSLLFVFTQSGNNVHALFEDMLREEQNFNNTALFSTLAPDNTLVAVDSQGNFFKSKPESLELEKKGENLKPAIVYDYQSSTNELPVKYGLNHLIAAGNNMVIILKESTNFSDTSPKIYVSYDNGLTYTEKEVSCNAPFVGPSDIGVPISIVFGDGTFILEGLTKTKSGYIDAHLFYSTDLETWSVSAEPVSDDYNLSYSNGYFFRIDETTINAKNGQDFAFMYSQGGNGWKGFNSPIAFGGTKDFVPVIAYINNAFYIFGKGQIYWTSRLPNMYAASDTDNFEIINTIDSHGWTDGVYKVEPYLNGALFFKEDGVFYCDVGQNGLTNKVDVYKTPTDGATVHYPNLFAQTGDLMMIGCSNFWDVGHTSNTRSHIRCSNFSGASRSWPSSNSSY